MHEAVDPAQINLLDHESVVFFTGAGMSAESGVPTFRGPGGVWKTYDYEEYACQEAFDADPARVWEFHNYRRGIVAQCEPNRGHRLIAELEGRLKVTVVTQNIDGLHQQAGSTHVVELHGGLWRVRCDGCGHRQEGRESPFEDPRCPACGGWLRPDIVWFGDLLDMSRIRAAEDAMAECDVMVAIGTSGVVFPAAALPMVAKQAGAAMVEVNVEPTEMSALYDVHLRGPAGEMLPRLMERSG